MYKLLSSGAVQRLTDFASIPSDARNADWADYKKWLAAGNIPLPADPVSAPDPVLEIDGQTGAVIGVAVHPVCGTDESIGILRDQLVQWGNALGLDFTDDFTRLNDIAIAAIKDSAARKAAITNA